MASQKMTEDYARTHRFKPPPEMPPKGSSSSSGVLAAKTPAKKSGKAPPTSLRHPASERPPSVPPAPATTREGRKDWDAAVKAGPPKPGPPKLPAGPPPPLRLASAVPERQAKNVQEDESGQIAKRLIERTRDRSLSRGRSRERRPPAEPQKRDWTRSRLTLVAPWQDKSKPTWHDNAKRKRDESTRGSSAPGTQQPKRPVDNVALLSDKTKTFHENMVAAAPAGSVDNGTWKDDVFGVHDIRDVINKEALGGMIQHV